MCACVQSACVHSPLRRCRLVRLVPPACDRDTVVLCECLVLNVLLLARCVYACCCMVQCSRCLQVQQLLDAVEEDQIGTHAPGAKDGVIAASKTTFADINDSATK